MGILDLFKRKPPVIILGGREMLVTQDIFDFTADLASRIEAGGNEAVANEIRNGLRSNTGLTDGWALFMESLERALSASIGSVGPRESNDLRDLLEVVRKAVYRL
jgi:hypothetical protein